MKYKKAHLRTVVVVSVPAENKSPTDFNSCESVYKKTWKWIWNILNRQIISHVSIPNIQRLNQVWWMLYIVSGRKVLLVYHLDEYLYTQIVKVRHIGFAFTYVPHISLFPCSFNIQNIPTCVCTFCFWWYLGLCMQICTYVVMVIVAILIVFMVVYLFLKKCICFFTIIQYVINLCRVPWDIPEWR